MYTRLKDLYRDTSQFLGKEITVGGEIFTVTVIGDEGFEAILSPNLP